MIGMKPRLLLCSPLRYATQSLEKIKSAYGVHLIEATDRQSFLRELASEQCSDAKAIYRPLDLMAKFGRFDEQVLRSFPKSIKYIVHNGAGYDQIDVSTARSIGLQISNTPGVVNNATADTALFLVLGALRNFNTGIMSLRDNRFREGFETGNDPRGKTIGILGMGGIGRAVAARVRALGMNVMYHNRRKLNKELEKGARYVALEDLLNKSDVISVHLPLTGKTRHFLSRAQFNKMKPGVVLVNTARGPIVDEEALVTALRKGRVGCVGLDVYEDEPNVHPGLLKNEKCILLPHVGTVSMETQAALEDLAMKNALGALEHDSLLTPVP